MSLPASALASRLILVRLFAPMGIVAGPISSWYFSIIAINSRILARQSLKTPFRYASESEVPYRMVIKSAIGFVSGSMRVLLIGHDFDFSAGDGISRYSLEMYKGLSRYAEVKTIATGKLPRPARALLNISVRDADIVHLMYPDVAKVSKGKAKMVTTWHDLRMFNKYLEEGQYKVKPKLVERFNIANSIIRNWTIDNYRASDGLVFNSSQTQKELKSYLTSQKVYDPKKVSAVTTLGVDTAFLRTRPG